MELWRSRGAELLPELAEQISQAEEPMEAWIEISSSFQKAYREPRDEDLIRRTYEFAFWSLEHGERDPQAGRDLPTCVVVGFLEEIPIYQASREDMPRWFTRPEVLAMRETFTYLYTGEFESLLALWDERESSPRAERSGSRLPGEGSCCTRSALERLSWRGASCRGL